MADLQGLLDGIVDEALFLLDGDACVRSWNEGARRLTGHGAAEVLGRHVALLELDGGAGERRLAEARAHGRSEGEGWCVRRDGMRVWTSVAVTALPQGGFAVRLRAVTEPGRDPLDVVAHDLRSPLGVLSMQVELLLHRWDRLGEDERREQLGVVARASERAVAALDAVVEGQREAARRPPS